MISLHITLGLCHLMFVIKTGSSCGGNSALEGKKRQTFTGLIWHICNRKGGNEMNVTNCNMISQKCSRKRQCFKVMTRVKTPETVVEMCKGGSTTAHHFYLHGSPAGDVQRCDCSLTLTGVAGSVYFTRAPLTDTTATCGGTLTLPSRITVDCTRTSRVDLFLYSGTSVVSFAYNTANVRNCLEVDLAAIASSISITCPGSTTTPTHSTATTTTNTSMSSPTTTTTSETTPTEPTTTTIPLQADNLTLTSASTHRATTPLSLSTSTTVPASAPTSTMTSSSENRSTPYVTQTQPATDYSKSGSTTVASHANTSFPVAAVAGGVGAGLLLLVVVVVVVLCYRRGRHVDKQEEEKGPTNVITVTNSLYESSAATTNTQPTERLTIAEQQDNIPMVEGQLPLDLASEQQDGTPNIAKQQDGTTAAVEHRDGTSGIYAVVNKPKRSSEVRTVTKQSVHDHAASYVDPDFSKATKSVSPPPIEDKVIYAKVDKSSLKNKL